MILAPLENFDFLAWIEENMWKVAFTLMVILVVSQIKFYRLAMLAGRNDYSLLPF